MFANNNPANYDNLIPILSLSAAQCIGPLRVVIHNMSPKSGNLGKKLGISEFKGFSPI